MKAPKALIVLASIGCSVSSHAVTLVDTFDTPFDYTTGYTGGPGSGNVTGTIWDGFDYNNGFDGTQDTVVSTAGNSGGTLNFSSANGSLEFSADDAMLLYINVAQGLDFTASVELASYSYVNFHTAAIVARSTAGPGSTHVQAMYLDAFGVGGQLRATLNGGTANINSNDSGPEPYSAGMTLQLQKVGDVFTTSYFDSSGSLLDTDSVSFPELAAVDLQVGLSQATFSPESPTLSFDNFELTVVPEPSSLLLIAGGLAGFVLPRRRR